MELKVFYEIIFKGIEGIVGIATKHKTTHEFTRYYYEWPKQKDLLLEHTVKMAVEHETYFMPALLQSSSSSKKSNLLATNCFWVEADTKVLDTTAIPKPTIVVETSPGKSHMYWVCNTPITDMALVENVNKSLMYILGVDKVDDSGWDATQLLRPISTLNHKYGDPLSVEAQGSVGDVYAIDLFQALPHAPIRAQVEEPKLLNVPKLEEIIFKYALSSVAINIFSTGISTSKKDDGSSDRSGTLMQLAYELAKAKVTPEDMMAMLLHLDSRIKKFDGREDQYKKLLEIITVAINKYPDTKSSTISRLSDLKVSFMSLLSIERSVEWVLEGLIETNGNAMLVGPPGLGKSTLTLDAAAHMAIGKPYLGFNVIKPTKVMFVSLEMSDIDLKKFIEKQVLSYTEEEKQLLHENFHVLPLGQPYFLNYKAQQTMMLEMIEENKIKGLLIDSLSRATDKPLQDETSTRDLMGWVDATRSQMNMFFYWVHHNRKPSGDNKKPKTLADVYGSVFITSALTSCAVLWTGKGKHNLELSFVKSRLAEEPDPFEIIRNTKTLSFSRPAVILKESYPDITTFEEFKTIRLQNKTNAKVPFI